nr:retrovirus-related Pol polyprotein from transposon TNT 1-94 [Tanacetum cinerariifolium]
MRPFGCSVTILNTLDHLGKFQGKVDEGFLVGYSVCNKAFRVFNSRTRIVQETLHVNFIENKPNVVGSGPAWLFDTRTMNYHPVIAENQTKSHAEKAEEEGTHTYVLFPVLSDGSTDSQNKNKDAFVDGKEHDDDIQNTNEFSAVGPSNDTASPTAANSSSKDAFTSTHDSDMPNLEDLTHSDDEDDVGAEADINNLESIISTRSMARAVRDQAEISQMFNEDFHTCMFTCFLSQEEPKRVHQALKDPSWIKAMQEDLLQFKMQKV